jgi:hypothetical protein
VEQNPENRNSGSCQRGVLTERAMSAILAKLLEPSPVLDENQNISPEILGTASANLSKTNQIPTMKYLLKHWFVYLPEEPQDYKQV